MRILFIIILNFLSMSLFAQGNMLSQYANGTFVDSKVIYDSEKDDVYGYLLLYKKDKKASDVYEYEYVILDNTLNKISSLVVDQRIMGNIFAKEICLARKFNDKIIFGTYDDVTNNQIFTMGPMNTTYFTFDINKVEFSPNFYFHGNEKLLNETSRELEVKYEHLFRRDVIKPINSKYLLNFTFADYDAIFKIYFNLNKIFDDRLKKINGFSLLDKDFKVLWTHSYNSDVKKSFDEYQLMMSGEESFVMLKTIHNGSKSIKFIEVFRIKDGKLLNSIPYINDDFSKKIVRLDTEGENFNIIMNLYKLKDKKLLSQDILGFSKLSIDKNTGQLVSNENVLWDTFAKHFQIKKPTKSGKIHKEGNLLMRDFITLNSGNHLALFEVAEIKKKEDILKDLYFIEFDKNLNILKIDKQQREANSSMKYGRINSHRFTQKLNTKGDFVFYYDIYEKENKKLTHKLGISTYVNNAITHQKVSLVKGKSKIEPVIAKNGYILLMEYDTKNKAVEQRLEKINL